MKITVVMEDTAEPGLIAQHGLCLYVETKGHRLLMDTGASEDTWINAGKLGIDLKAVDTVIISHGHYDHAGGLMSLVKLNPDVKVYMQRGASGKFYHKEKYIGIDERIPSLSQMCICDGNLVIDEELELFTGITGRRYRPKSNLSLSEHVGTDIRQDAFVHEQCLVIRSGEKTVLLSGCAHNGILNILDKFAELFGCCPDIVVSGFHMAQKAGYGDDDRHMIRSTAEELAKLPCVFYTGHCTGQEAYDMMKEIMGDNLLRICAGTTITLS